MCKYFRNDYTCLNLLKNNICLYKHEEDVRTAYRTKEHYLDYNIVIDEEEIILMATKTACDDNEIIK